MTDSSNSAYPFIGLAGNIGVGKTTFTSQMAERQSWTPFYESVSDNPYLSDFYGDMKRWSFNLQIYFLHNRFESHLHMSKCKGGVIQDRTIYEDAYIFAPNLHSMGLMSTRDFDTYQSLFTSVKSMVSAPDLLIYLRATIPALVNQIQKRGRDYEDSIRLDYLKRLNERYEAWISTYTEGKLLIIEVDDMDFESKPEDLGAIISKVDANIHGLF